MSGTSQTEGAKRLEPIFDTKRELFLLSGNLCAFPGCLRPIMNPEGNFVGQICHIEAADEGGERFNANQTNEERRSVSNLMLMCYEHHVVTNDVALFSVERLKEIKRTHESRVFEFIEKMSLDIQDTTKSNIPKFAKTLAKINHHLWSDRLTPAELNEGVDEVHELLKKLSRLPKSARQLLAIAVDRGFCKRSTWLVVFDDLEAACNIGTEEFHSTWMILDHHRITFDGGYSENGQALGGIRSLNSGWNIWEDLKSFADANHASLVEVIVNLDFSLLD